MNWGIRSLCFALLALGAFSVRAEEPAVLRIAYMESAFKGIAKADIVAAMTVWAEQLARSRNINLEAVVDIHPDRDALLRAVRSDTADLIAMPVLDFLPVRDDTLFEPCFLGSRQGSPLDRYLVLAPTGGVVRTLKDLADREVLIQTMGTMTGAREWLEVALHDAGAGAPRRVEDVVKPAEAVLPVFFGKKDACVATEASFRSMVELNPQVGRALTVLAQSEPLATGIVCVRRSYQQYRKEALEEIPLLDRTPRGKQILTLLKYDGVVPFDEAALQSMRDLIARHAALRPAAAGAPP